jgi:DNA-binding winged helix-turn-helix (wHTH) protein/pimeloyl-ACP methyl ester carboxylesterase
MSSEGQCYRFGDCALDPGTRELRVGGAVVAVQPKVFDLLLYLVEQRNRVVSKDELQDAIWTGTIVTETALTRAVMKARRAIGDDPDRQSAIQTVQRHGYRFIAPVTLVEPSPAAEGSSAIELGPVQFTSRSGVHIAWRTAGDGPTDLLFVPGFVSHLEVFPELREAREFFMQLGAGRRLIMFDKRGTGLSERVGYAPTLQDTAADILAVMDAAGSRQAVLFGISEGGPASLWFAHAHPERVRQLVVWGSMAKGTRTEDYPWTVTREQYDRWLDELVAGWGGPVGVEVFAPEFASLQRIRDWWAKLVRSATTPSGMRAVLQSLRDLDVREVLPAIRVPTVIVHRVGDVAVRIGAGRHLAEHIPGARLVELPGSTHWAWLGEFGGSRALGLDQARAGAP